VYIFSPCKQKKKCLCVKYGYVMYDLTSLGARNVFSKFKNVHVPLDKFRGLEMHF
jgi:hypothetical protein